MQHGVVAEPLGILIENILLFHKLIAYRDTAIQVHDLQKLRPSRVSVGKKVSNCEITLLIITGRHNSQESNITFPVRWKMLDDMQGILLI
jgi:hypothetical protein